MTSDGAYTQRLSTLEGARWKRWLNVQAPYRWNLHRMKLGRVLDIGCGIGRNLVALDAGSVGVDHNAESIAVARSRGCTAWTTEEFPEGPDATLGGYDSLLLAHVVEHMPEDDAVALLADYLPYLKPDGRIVLICPQEKGYTTDSTHVNFLDEQALADLLGRIGFRVASSTSFPFPRRMGRVFTYNEFVVIGEND